MTMNDRFLKACRGEKTDKIPVWFMRQAGRLLPSYRELRKKHGLLELTQTPEIAAEVSMEPVEKLGVDAAILFADIMLLPMALGIDLDIVDNVGPVVKNPIDSMAAIESLKSFDVKNIAYLQETIRILRTKLQVPLIGFSGAPFTIASYLIEGKATRTWTATKRFMLEKPEAWAKLMTVLSDATIQYLGGQIDAGAQAVQLFDSWVGCLSPSDYRKYVLPYVQKIFAGVKDKGVPRIHFATDTAGMLEDFSNVDAEVIGLDWRIDIAKGKKIVGAKSVQGNLDPTALLAEDSILFGKVDEIVDQLPSRDGFIFNLGHGILPETDHEKVKRMVDYIHSK